MHAQDDAAVMTVAHRRISCQLLSAYTCVTGSEVLVATLHHFAGGHFAPLHGDLHAGNAVAPVAWCSLDNTIL